MQPIILALASSQFVTSGLHLAPHSHDPSNPDYEKWVEAMDAEITGLIDKEGTLKAVEMSEVKPGDDVLPSILTNKLNVRRAWLHL